MTVRDRLPVTYGCGAVHRRLPGNPSPDGFGGRWRTMRRGFFGSVADFFAYWTQFIALTLWGPATQDRQTDPVEELKRKYGKHKAA